MKKLGMALVTGAMIAGQVSAELKPDGTILLAGTASTSKLGKTVTDVGFATVTPAGRSTSAYLVVSAKNDHYYIPLRRETKRIARPAGCTGYDGQGALPDGSYAIHSDVSVVHCTNARLSTLEISGNRGADQIHAKETLTPVIHTQSVE